MKKSEIDIIKNSEKNNNLNSETALLIVNKLNEIHKNPICELNFSSNFELLVAVILSAQCTDKRVNEVTNVFFKIANTPKALSEMPLDQIEHYIKPCGFYKNKANNIKLCANILIKNFNGEVPSNFDDLIKLPGVGRKTANVMLSVAFNKQAIAVDTHVYRVSLRIGLAKSTDILEVEKELMKLINKEYWTLTHHLLIHHGRYICNSNKPKCDQCNITKYCNFYKINNNCISALI